MKRIVPVGLIGVGFYWCVMSVKYGLWVRKGPGGGFLPMVAGLLTVLIGLLVLKNSWKEETLGTFSPKVLIPIGAMIAIALSSKLIGLLGAIIVYLFCWLNFYSKTSLKTSIIVSIVCPAIIYAIFVVWLKVPVPTGLIGNL